mmetsp:Transcript_44508/g.141717  ORF Transcript_44508/g.141717 Transcript_44508/m.141717 type:complete len:250 (+) Transcript_44508:2-751(+)
MPAQQQPPPGGLGGMGGPGGPGDVPGLDGLSPFAQSMAKAYGGKFLASGHSFVQSKMGFLGSATLHYYFNVNTNYVVNKLKVLLCPFLHKGSWTRIPEQVAGGLTFKAPRHDINAPDLYIPIMAFFTYAIAYCCVEVVGDRFSPEDMSNGVWWHPSLLSVRACGERGAAHLSRARALGSSYPSLPSRYCRAWGTSFCTMNHAPGVAAGPNYRTTKPKPSGKKGHPPRVRPIRVTPSQETTLGAAVVRWA